MLYSEVTEVWYKKNYTLKLGFANMNLLKIESLNSQS